MGRIMLVGIPSSPLSCDDVSTVSALPRHS